MQLLGVILGGAQRIDDDLRAVLESWSSLCPESRRAIRAVALSLRGRPNDERNG